MNKEYLLLRLISSLSKTEKRKFRFLAQSGRKEKEYLQLYDKLEKLIAKKGVLQKIPKINGITNPPRAKNQLLQQLFFALRTKYQDATQENKFNNKIHDAYLLQKRGMADLSFKLLQQIKEEAKSYGENYIVLSIIDKQLNLTMNSMDKDILNQTLGLQEEKQRTLQRITKEQDFINWRYQAFLLFRKDNNLRNAETQQKGEELLQKLISEKHTTNTFNAQEALYDALALLHRLKRQSAEAGDYYNQLLELWENKQFMIKAYPNRYKLHLYNYLNTLLNLEDYLTFERNLKKVENYPARFLEEEVEDFQNIDFLVFLKLMNTDKLEKAEEMVKELDSKLEDYSKKMEKLIEARRLSIYYNIAILYFVLEDYNKAETFFLKISTQHEAKEQRLDLIYLSKVLILIVYFEKGTKENEKKLDDRTIKFLKRKNSYKPFEKLVRENITKLRIAKFNKEPLKPQLERFLFKLQELKSTTKLRNGVEEVELWIRSKLENKRIRDLLP